MAACTVAETMSRALPLERSTRSRWAEMSLWAELRCGCGSTPKPGTPVFRRGRLQVALESLAREGRSLDENLAGRVDFDNVHRPRELRASRVVRVGVPPAGVNRAVQCPNAT